MKFFQITVTQLLLAACLLSGCGANKTAPQTPASPKVPETDTRVEVVVKQAQLGTLTEDYPVVGNVDSPSKADVSPRVSGQITQMELLKNRRVEEGQPLAVLAQGDLGAQRLQAEAALSEAQLNLQSVQAVSLPQSSAQLQKNLADAQALYSNSDASYQRRLQLYNRGGLSLKDLQVTELALSNAKTSLQLAKDNLNIHKSGVVPNATEVARARIEQARERLAALDAQISQTVVRAPISGTITDQYLYQGDYATQGTKIVSLADLSRVLVKVNVPDNLASELSKGLPVTIVPQSNPNAMIPGNVSLISLSANRVNRTVEVWCAPESRESSRLKIGDAVEVIFKIQRPQSVLVPKSAVTLDSPSASTGVVDIVDSQSIAQEIRVTVGQSNNQDVEVLKGLTGRETVIVDGNFHLPAGTRVVTKSGH